jgi:hypothetical protein
LTIQQIIEHDGLIVGLIALHFATVQAGDDDALDDAFLEPFTLAVFAAGTCAAVMARLRGLVPVRMRGEFGGADKVISGDDLL